MLLASAALVCPVAAGDFQVRSAQSSLSRNGLDQQFVQGEAQSAQTLLRIEESRRLNQQSYVRLLPAARVDLMTREEYAGPERAQKYAQELQQLSDRLRELETQRKALVQMRSTRRTLPILDD